MNLANRLTLFRMVIILPLGMLFYSQSTLAMWGIVALYILAGVSDYFDGYIARKWNQASDFGKLFDPIADKLLVTALLFLLVQEHSIASLHVWAAIIIVAREILVSGLREFKAGKGGSIPVSQLAKWKTTVQMVALFLFLLARPLPTIPLINLMAIVCLWLSAGLSVWTAWAYIKGK